MINERAFFPVSLDHGCLSGHGPQPPADVARMPGRGTPNAKQQPAPASCLTNGFSGLSGYPGPLASAAGGSVLESLRSSLDAFAWLQSVSKSPAAVPLIFHTIYRGTSSLV